MREELKPLEGQKVVYIGRLKERVTNADGGWDICLRAVEIRPLRTDTPMKRVAPIKLDHCWLRAEADQVEFKGMMARMEGAAVVGWYCRSDETIDLGLRPIPGLDLDNVWLRGRRIHRRSERIDLVLSAADALEDGGYVYWSWVSNAENTKEALLKAANSFMKGSAANIGALLVAPNYGPCHRMRAADPFAGMRRRSRRAAA